MPAGAGIAVKFGFSYSEMKSLKFSQFNGIALLLSVSALLSSCGRGLPSKLEHLPEDLNGTGLNLTGIYPDGWVGDSGSVTLQQPAGKQMLSILGTVPLIGDPNFRGDAELRLDEKAVTERAYDNPVFVEDLVRNVALKLKAHPDVSWFKVEAENHESIHNHNAYACLEQG